MTYARHVDRVVVVMPELSKTFFLLSAAILGMTSEGLRVAARGKWGSGPIRSVLGRLIPAPATEVVSRWHQWWPVRT